MQAKKENLINKIVKKDFNNELESALEQKAFEENAKSSLLSILYKIEAAYKDIETVKQDIETKEEYIERLISIIYGGCRSIKIIRMDSENNRIPPNGTFYIDKQKNEIECYPIERKILYAIWKIGKKERIINNKYYLIDTVLSDFLNVGNTIQKVEPLRDFNGYSWTTLNNEIESIEHNLIYQNLRMLLGNQFLENWVYTKEFIIDYYEEFNEKLKKEYGKENAECIIDMLIKISILLEMKFDPKKLDGYLKDKKLIDKELEDLSNKQKYIEIKTKQKLELLKNIRQIDSILSNKDLLQKEYIKRNEDLPLNKKIFSMRVLSNIMEKEREEAYAKIEEINVVLNPKNFVEHKKELEYKRKYLQMLEAEDVKQELTKYILEFQKVFLKCFESQIEKVETKQQAISLIYQYRYYLLLPVDYENNILEKAEQMRKESGEKFDEKAIKEVMLKLINKAITLKAIPQFSKNEDYQYEIWKNILQVRVIKIEDLSLKMVKEKNRYFVQLFDEKVFEEKTEVFAGQEVNEKELDIKLNKRIKIFE